MRVVTTFRTCSGPPEFCIDLKADWLITLHEVREKSLVAMAHLKYSFVYALL